MSNTGEGDATKWARTHCGTDSSSKPYSVRGRSDIKIKLSTIGKFVHVFPSDLQHT